MATMNGGAAVEEGIMNVAEEEELSQSSSKGNIAVSLSLACLGIVFAMWAALDPGLTACCAGVAGAASFGWDVYVRGEIEHILPEMPPASFDLLETSGSNN